MKKILLILTVSIVCNSCNMLEYHPYDPDPKYHNINKENIRKIEEKFKDKETIRFVWMGDSQRWYDETEDCVADINKRDDIDFVIHGGDISDFGMTREFEWVHDMMKKLKVPYVALVGNHDLLGNGLQVYESMYGKLDFSFIAGKTKFLCVNTNALEFDYSRSVPDLEYIKREKEKETQEQYDKTVVVMHANPFGDQFTANSAYPFQEAIKKMKSLQFCLHAHAHALMVNDFFEDGIIYYGCDAMKGRSYMLFTLTASSYKYEVIHF